MRLKISKPMRFRISSSTGELLGWISRETRGEADKVLKRVFPDETVEIAFLESDQD